MTRAALYRRLAPISAGLFILMVVGGAITSVARHGTLPSIHSGFNGATAVLQDTAPTLPIEQLEVAMTIAINERWIHRYNLAVGMARAGRIEEAISNLKWALRRKPNYALAHRDLGQLWLGKNPAAIKHLVRAIELRPDDAYAWFLLGNALGMQRRWDQAIGAYRKAIEGGFVEAKAHHNFATALKNTGQMEAARAELHAALKIDPTYTRSKRALARMAAAAKKADR